MRRSQQETAGFVAELCAELRELTDGARLDSLTYLLDMAALEAARIAEPVRQAKTAA